MSMENSGNRALSFWDVLVTSFEFSIYPEALSDEELDMLIAMERAIKRAQAAQRQPVRTS